MEELTPVFIKERTFVKGWAAVYPSGHITISETREGAESGCDGSCLGVIYIESELVKVENPWLKIEEELKKH